MKEMEKEDYLISALSLTENFGGIKINQLIRRDEELLSRTEGQIMKHSDMRMTTEYFAFDFSWNFYYSGFFGYAKYSSRDGHPSMISQR